MLGIACLYTGDLGGAFSYLSRSEQLQENNVDALLGLAAVHLGRRETDEALRTWLEVLDVDPRNRIAQSGLALMRRGLDPDQIRDLVESRKLRKLFPPLPFRIPIIVPISLAVLAIGLGTYLLATYLVPMARQTRPGLEDIEIASPRPPLIDDGTSTLFTFSDREVTAIFAAAKEHLAQYRDNLAVVEINRLLLSNASSRVKESASLLMTLVQEPDFSSVRDSFAFDVVRSLPTLYGGAYVVWEGKIDKLRIGADRISFDLLVGYQDEQELLGVVYVELDFAADVENGMALRVLGRVIASGQQFVLTGVSIQKLYLR